VLNVISRSPSDIQPVLDSIVATAGHLCSADWAMVFTLRKGRYHLAAAHGAAPSFVTFIRENPISPGHGTLTGRTALEKRTIYIQDALTDPTYQWREAALKGNYRSTLGVPLLRAGEVIGVIAVVSKEVKAFTDKQVRLVETFADQAVIAIENARLFEEVQARTRELQESLEYQTATSDVLSVISRSRFELQPVFATIVETAGRLCHADFATVLRLGDDGKYHIAAHYGYPHEFTELFERHPIAPGRDTVAGRVALERTTIHITDVLADPEYNYHEAQKLGGYRAVLGVPLLREGDAIGVLALAHATPAPFTAKQIELVETFADQAVIAIETGRLFEEVQARTRELTRSVAELTALGEVTQAVNSSLELQTVLNTILEHACRLADAGGGAIYVFDETSEEFSLATTFGMRPALIAAIRQAHPRLDEDSPLGRSSREKTAVQVSNLEAAPDFALRQALLTAGIRALLIVPLLREDRLIGALVVRRKRTGAFEPGTVRLLEAFAAQSALAIHNARLFREIAEKSRQLEVASQHKSQFVANMSHELRTPLAAILGYAELMQEGFLGPLPDKAKATLARMQANGKHLLGLINSVLDISKIEAGQFKLNLAEYALDGMVETVRVGTESLAGAKKLALEVDVAPNLPRGFGDEQRLTQVLLNLVGNAIKFTDKGRVRIAAGAADGQFSLDVSDTGPGIPPEERDRIFEEFHQIDNTTTRAKGGTGLGLAIAKQIIEMHGGRIWVESRPGEGATFHVMLPVRAEAAKRVGG
jgi:signal transduction histidine kinase